MEIRTLVRLLQPTKPRTVEEWMERHNKRPIISTYLHSGPEYVWLCLDALGTHNILNKLNEPKELADLPIHIYSALEGVGDKYIGHMHARNKEILISNLKNTLIQLGEIECH